MTTADHIDGGTAKQRLKHLAPSAAPPTYSRTRSRVIRVTKIALPLIALTMLVTALAWPSVRDRMVSFAGFDPASVDAAADDYQVFKMSIRGIDNSDRPYTFTAETAIKYDPEIEEIELLRPTADFELKNGSWLAVMANSGHYLKNRKVLLLEDEVNLFHDEGYEVNTSAAVFSLETSEVHSDRPTHGHGELSEIDAAGGMRIYADGDRVLFKGPATIVIYPDHEDGQ